MCDVIELGLQKWTDGNFKVNFYNAIFSANSLIWGKILVEILIIINFVSHDVRPNNIEGDFFHPKIAKLNI